MAAIFCCFDLYRHRPPSAPSPRHPSFIETIIINTAGSATGGDGDRCREEKAKVHTRPASRLRRLAITPNGAFLTSNDPGDLEREWTTDLQFLDTCAQDLSVNETGQDPTRYFDTILELQKILSYRGSGDTSRQSLELSGCELADQYREENLVVKLDTKICDAFIDKVCLTFHQVLFSSYTSYSTSTLLLHILPSCILACKFSQETVFLKKHFCSNSSAGFVKAFAQVMFRPKTASQPAMSTPFPSVGQSTILNTTRTDSVCSVSTVERSPRTWARPETCRSSTKTASQRFSSR